MTGSGIRTAIVTGGALGIGGGVSRQLASEGIRVLIVDLDESAARATAEQITADGGVAEVMIGDVAEEETARSMVDRSMELSGRLDILVQNAYGGGRGRGGDAVTIETSDWDSGMGLLARALFLGAKYAVPAMRQSGGGSIVNMSSAHGILQSPRSLIYEAGKSAVIGMTKQMAVAFGPDGIRVNAIAPGHILTERQRKGWDEYGNAEGYRFFELQYPVRRCGTVEDIGHAVSFLCADRASFITGVTLPVDGGLTIQLQENLAMDLKDYAIEHPGMRFPYGGGPTTTARR